MSDCGCDKAKKDLEEYLHHELDKADAADIREHMANCPDCAREHRVGVVLRDTVRRACTGGPAHAGDGEAAGHPGHALTGAATVSR
jgi:anti-sigma factor (TIGR02949 family)